jgi:uncharacterized protein
LAGPNRPTLRMLFRVVAVAACCLMLAAPASRAQSGGGFSGFLQNLFGGPPKPPPPQARPSGPLRVRAEHKPRKKVQDFVSTAATRAPGAPGGGPVQPTFFVSVLGDSLGILTAQGLAEAFADKPEVSIANLARDLSGLTRDDYFDWPKAAHDLASGKTKIDIAVVMLGINDLQPLKEGADMLDPLSDKWRVNYGQRVENLVAPFHDAHIPVLWVGLPSMQDERFNAQVIALNAIFREHAEKAGAKFVDIWDAFADQNGQYAAFGPDVDGQNAKLRAGPGGIYLTKAGARKLAHFLEADIRRALDKTKPQDEIATLPPDIEQQADDINAQIRREMGAAPAPGEPAANLIRPEAGPIVSLTARPVSARGELIGALPMTGGSLAAALRLGQAPPPQAGRADDFAWPRPE